MKCGGRWIKHVGAAWILGVLGCSGPAGPAATADAGGGTPEELEEAAGGFGDSTSRWTIRGIAPNTRFWGVQVEHAGAPALADAERVIDEILDLKGNRSTCDQYRTSRVRLLLTSTVSWAPWAADPEGQARELTRNLEAVRRRGVAVALLLEPHGAIPPAVARRYGAPSQCRRDDGTTETCRWIPYPPDSAFWDEVRAWQVSVIQRIAHLAPDPLVAVFVLNEPQFDTRNYQTQGRSVQYAEERLAYLEARLTQAAQTALGDRAEASVKYYAYPLSQRDDLRQQTGLSGSQLSYYCNDVLGAHLLGLDAYPTRNGFSLTDNLNLVNAQCRQNQRYLLAEWNVGANCGSGYCDNQATPSEIRELASRVRSSRSRLLGASIFCWNCNGSWTLSRSQRQAFADGFRTILSRSSPCTP